MIHLEDQILITLLVAIIVIVGFKPLVRVLVAIFFDIKIQEEVSKELFLYKDISYKIRKLRYNLKRFDDEENDLQKEFISLNTEKDEQLEKLRKLGIYAWVIRMFDVE